MSFGSFMYRLHHRKKKNKKSSHSFNHEDVFSNLSTFLLISEICIILSIAATIVELFLLPTIVSIISGIFTIIMQLFVIVLYTCLRKFVKIVKNHDDEIEELKNHMLPPPSPNSEYSND